MDSVRVDFLKNLLALIVGGVTKSSARPLRPMPIDIDRNEGKTRTSHPEVLEEERDKEFPSSESTPARARERDRER